MNKEQTQRVVDQLPDDVSPDELVERLISLQRFEQGHTELTRKPLVAMKKQANS